MSQQQRFVAMGLRLRGDDSGEMGRRCSCDDSGKYRDDGAFDVYYVYILASRRHGTLYVGVANNVQNRLELHRIGLGSAFVKKYNIHCLVHVEPYENAEDAIRREKQLKKWNRDWKIRLIEEDNPEWADRASLLT